MCRDGSARFVPPSARAAASANLVELSFDLRKRTAGDSRNQSIEGAQHLTPLGVGKPPDTERIIVDRLADDGALRPAQPLRGEPQALDRGFIERESNFYHIDAILPY